MKLRFDKTCEACPEQYEVFDERAEYAGYVRLRHGYFCVEGAHRECLFERSFPLDENDPDLTFEERVLLRKEGHVNPDGVFQTDLQTTTYLGIAEDVISEYVHNERY